MHLWDIFCRVVDNYGDIGTCWRLARQLADEFQVQVRLWVDDLEAFSRLCPSISVYADSQFIGQIEVRHWTADFRVVDAADVVVEAFACEIPVSYVGLMAQCTVAPVWINLEYLSAEAWVEDCHLLASPHPRFSLPKYFFFPGFTARTGGLLREDNLLSRRETFDSAAETAFWYDVCIPERTSDEIRISLFCYANAALPDLLAFWAAGSGKVRLLVAPGAANDQIAGWFGAEFPTGAVLRKDSLTVHALPFLSQDLYDRLIWSCDVNFVRGEESFVRAQWAQRPFVWQIYPQSEQTHLVKLDAFLARYLEGFTESEAVKRCWNAWNGVGDAVIGWREFHSKRDFIQKHGKVWALHLDRQRNLANNLTRFVREKRGG